MKRTARRFALPDEISRVTLDHHSSHQRFTQEALVHANAAEIPPKFRVQIGAAVSFRLHHASSFQKSHTEKDHGVRENENVFVGG